MTIVVDPAFSVYQLIQRLVNSSTPLKHRRAMSYVSFEIEDALIGEKATGRVFAGFQRMRKFLPQVARYKKLAAQAERVYVFGIPDAEVPEIENVVYVPLKQDDLLAKEWFLILHGLNYYTALATQEVTNVDDPDEARVFKGVWTFDLEMVSLLEEWLTSAVDAPSLDYTPEKYDHKKQVEIMTGSITHLIQRSNLTDPAKTDSQEIVAGDLKSTLKEAVGPHLAELEGTPLVETPPQEQEVVVLFSDIRGFTNLAESMTPSELVMDIINPYMAATSRAIVNHQGIIDKFVGDGVLAVFGLNDAQGPKSESALQAAAEMLQNLSSLPRKIEVGIGIARGVVHVDSIGSELHKEKTIIGDIVNIAQRLSDLGRNEIYLSHTAAESMSSQENLIRYGEIVLKGKAQPHLVYRFAPSGS